MYTARHSGSAAVSMCLRLCDWRLVLLGALLAAIVVSYKSSSYGHMANAILVMAHTVQSMQQQFKHTTAMRRHSTLVLSLYLFTTASTMYIGSERPGLGLMSCDSAGLNKPL
eukprot:4807-Heterococcus_DN1.PRE.3